MTTTTGVAAYLNGTADVAGYVDDHPAAIWILFAVQLGLVVGLSFLIKRISATVATLMFALYAGVTGLAFAFICGRTFNLIIGWAGLIAFSGLTAYDMPKLKQWLRGGFGGEEQQRKA